MASQGRTLKWTRDDGHGEVSTQSWGLFSELFPETVKSQPQGFGSRKKVSKFLKLGPVNRSLFCQPRRTKTQQKGTE